MNSIGAVWSEAEGDEQWIHGGRRKSTVVSKVTTVAGDAGDDRRVDREVMRDDGT